MTVHHAPASSSRPARGIASEHAFSAGTHYDPANTHHGLLLSHDDHRLAAACGFPRHAHRDVDVASVVLAGTLVHRDAAGSDALVPAGSVSMWGPGGGSWHSEHATGAGPVRVLQLNLAGGVPHPHRTVRVDEAPRSEGWAVVAGYEGALGLTVPGSRVLVRELKCGTDLTVPEASWCHLTVATGAVDLPDQAGSAEPARAGCTVRAAGMGPWGVRARVDSVLVAVVGRIDLRWWLEAR